MGIEIVFHRGRHGVMPDGTSIEENTFEAFERAIEEGARVVEMDVWTNMAVVHDPGIQSVPKLPEILERIAGRCKVNVEIKSPQTAPEVIRFIKGLLATKLWTPEHFILSAFHHDTALLCAETLPEVTAGAIMQGVPTAEYIDSLNSAGISNLHLHWTNIYMDIEASYKLRTDCQKRGMAIWIWTVNEPEVFKVLKKYGVDAVFTNTPHLLLE